MLDITVIVGNSRLYPYNIVIYRRVRAIGLDYYKYPKVEMLFVKRKSYKVRNASY